MKNEMYLVIVARGQYEDYHKQQMFVTADKQKAERWVKRFNSIIESNNDRINRYYRDKQYDKPQPFWYDEIAYHKPFAYMTEVELR